MKFTLAHKNETIDQVFTGEHHSDGDELVMYLQRRPNYTIVTDLGHTCKRLHLYTQWKELTEDQIDHLSWMGVQYEDGVLFAYVIGGDAEVAIGDMVKAIGFLSP